jgi:hypothetical protein
MSSDVQSVRDVIGATFVELHGITHAEAVERLPLVRVVEMWRQAERVTRRQVDPAAWASYRAEAAAATARQSRRAANGNTAGREAMRVTREPGVAVLWPKNSRRRRRG